jgi:hypothetical protein
MEEEKKKMKTTGMSQMQVICVTAMATSSDFSTNIGIFIYNIQKSINLAYNID